MKYCQLFPQNYLTNKNQLYSEKNNFIGVFGYLYDAQHRRRTDSVC